MFMAPFFCPLKTPIWDHSCTPTQNSHTTMEFVLLMETLKAANSAERKRGEGEAYVPLKIFRGRRKEED